MLDGSGRIFPGLVALACTKFGVKFTSYSKGWVNRIDFEGISHWIVGYGFDINNAGADRLACDKVAQFSAMYANDVMAIEHYLIKTSLDQDLDLSAMKKVKIEKFVIKPLDGSSGYGVALMNSVDQARMHIEEHRTREGTWAVSPWYDIVTEKRFVMLDGKCLLAYEKSTPCIVNDLKMFNLGLNAKAANIQPTKQELHLANRSMKACTLRLGAVDIVTLQDGSMRVMEVNSGIMAENYARMSDENYQQVVHMYTEIVRAVIGLSH